MSVLKRDNKYAKLSRITINAIKTMQKTLKSDFPKLNKPSPEKSVFLKKRKMFGEILVKLGVINFVENTKPLNCIM